MRMEPITRRTDSRLRELVERSRGDGDLVLLDGPKLVAEALAGRHPFELLLLGSELRAEEREHLLAAASGPAIEIDSRLERELTDTVTPRGALLLLPRPAPVRGRFGPLVVLDRVQDPGNVGAIVRVAEATGAAAVIATRGCARPFSPRAIRASAGSALRLAIFEPADEAAEAELLVGCRLLALEPGALTELTADDGERPVALVLGNEGQGLSERFRRAERRSLPMRGRVTSLSVLSAASIALWRLQNPTVSKA